VSDLKRSVDFYRLLFDTPPAKEHSGYAKFELEQPPLVFSLVPNPPASSGAVSHFGFPVSSAEEVDAAALRLQAAGLKTTCQQGTVCGYARQDKVWVADPDHNYWEIYVVHEDINPEVVRSGFDGVSPAAAAAHRDNGPADPSSARARVIWEHRVMQPAPGRISHEDGTVDEVRLEGTFNSALQAEDRGRLLTEVMRVLKDGGLVLVHGLVADRAVSSMPSLPGVASLVKRVPVESEALDELRDVGFENLRITKLSESPVFRSGPAEMREIKLTGMKSIGTTADSKPRRVVYKGPFAQAVDDQGKTFVRGVRTDVSEATSQTLCQSAAAKQFLFLGSEMLDESACAR
jgi:catechol 2,3-dioxygenase-like lactoylglutathione lyase family enzyme